MSLYKSGKKILISSLLHCLFPLHTVESIKRSNRYNDVKKNAYFKKHIIPNKKSRELLWFDVIIFNVCLTNCYRCVI